MAVVGAVPGPVHGVAGAARVWRGLGDVEELARLGNVDGSALQGRQRVGRGVRGMRKVGESDWAGVL